jgi:hypothetical protein
MSFKIGSDTVISSTGFLMPKYTTTTRPSSPTQGQVIFNTSTGKMEMYDGTNWRETSNERPFLYRQIITTGYAMAGYKDSSPWRNVARMVHATDVCTNLGDQLDIGAAYTSGACSLTYGYIWGADNAWPGTTTTTCAFNMATETTGGQNALWNMRAARNDSGTIFKEHQTAYIIGGGSGEVDIFNLTVNVMLATKTGPTTIDGQDAYQYGVGTLNDELCGYAYEDSGTKIKLNFASGAMNYSIASGAIYGNNSQQKGINSKVGRGWCGADGTYNGGYILYRWQFSTETSLGTTAKPVTNCGEENFDMGQERQYMMGCYDGGGQNNRGWKFTYATESGVELGAGSVRTGISGSSSGHCAWKG